MNKTNGRENKFKKKNIFILFAILAILIGHFALQMSFIEHQNRDVVELALKAEYSSDQTVQTARINTVADDGRKKEIKEPEMVLSPRPLESRKKSQAISVAQGSQNRQSQFQFEVVKAALRKKSKSALQSERLRRAEKILTGF